jgi:hypothetical protein
MTDIQRASGHTSVMASRHEAPDSLDLFQTPPWATRALIKHVLTTNDHIHNRTVLEPACGLGHMSEVLKESFRKVWATDVHDYGKHQNFVASFVGEGLDVLYASPKSFGWVITNPPFNLAAEFAERALTITVDGVALLVRTTWLESKDRYERLFRDNPPDTVALFCERVPMVKGRWDPEASTATSYAWVVWRSAKRVYGPSTALQWIPPGQRKALELPTDRERFA